MTATVIDNATAPITCQFVRKWLENQGLFYGWGGKDGTPGRFWHRNFVLPGTYENHYDQDAVREDLTFKTFIASKSPLAGVARQVSIEHFNGCDLTRIWVNVQTFGDESAIHHDFPPKFKGQSKSVVWYPVERWEPDWGGDLCLFGDDGEISQGVLVKPDRMVVFDGTTNHSARPLSRFSEVPRIAVAFGLETQQQ